MTGFFQSVFALSAIVLNGLTGDGLRARAHFDSNNVRVGDPMVLSIDFTGEADFSDIHPPAIASSVDRDKWRVYDTSAKTETYRNARRLTYRVRPLKEGVLEFPALAFSYGKTDGTGKNTVSTKSIPVRVKPGTQAALAGLESDGEDVLPMPDGIVIALSRNIPEDELFRWRMACRNPKADDFARFDFPEARLNEAACRTLEGAWAKALGIYSSLEWSIGQTPAVERGIVAALSRKYASPAGLPVWREVLRPVLRHSWEGRIAIISGVLLLVALVMALSARIVRALAALMIMAFFALPFAASAEDPFSAIERIHREMDEHMRRMMGIAGGGTSFSVNNIQQEPVDIKAFLSTDKPTLQTGDAFRFIISVETPKTHRLGQMRFSAAETYGLTFTGNPETLVDGKSHTTNTVVKRFAIPARYDVPFKGGQRFTVDGMVSSTVSSGSGNRRSTFSFSQNFSALTPTLHLEVQPLPGENRPEGFNGAVGTDFSFALKADRLRVETNDVVRIVGELSFSGYVPELDGEIDRDRNIVVTERYFIADGSPRTPGESIVYYDPGEKKYRTLEAQGAPLEYFSGNDDGAAQTVAVNASETSKGDGGVTRKAMVLRFSPGDSSPAVATVRSGEKSEEYGNWVRIDDGSHAGWVRREEAE